MTRKQTLAEIAVGGVSHPRIYKASVPLFVAALQALAEYEDWVRCGRGLGYDKSYYVGSTKPPTHVNDQDGAHAINPVTARALERQEFIDAQWNPDDPIDASMGALLRITDRGWQYLLNNKAGE